MGNKAHLRPHRKKRQASRTTGLLLLVLFIALVALATAVAASGHAILPAGRIIPLRGGRCRRPSRRVLDRAAGQQREQQRHHTAPDLGASRQTRRSGLSRRNGRTWTTCGSRRPSLNPRVPLSVTTSTGAPRCRPRCTTAGDVPVVCSIARSMPGTRGHSRTLQLARWPALGQVCAWPPTSS